MAPTVLGCLLKAFRYGTEGVKDKSDIVIQDEVDAASLLGQAAGFSPSDVRNAYEGKSAIVGHDKALQARRSALVEQFAMAVMTKDDEGKADARAAIAKFKEKNPNRRIQPKQLAQSVHNWPKRIREAEDGVYLPKKRRDVLEQGRFATGESCDIGAAQFGVYTQRWHHRRSHLNLWLHRLIKVCNGFEFSSTLWF